MAGDRLLRVLGLFADGDDGHQPAELCEVCARALEMSGAGIMLMSDELPRGSVCSSDPTSSTLEDLQFTMGEGPCIDAHRSGRPVMEPDLADPEVPRWPAFAIPAVSAGARAVFGFPMRVGAVRLGALNLYRDHAGPLTDDQHADALVMADVAAQQVLAIQAQAPPGAIAAELEAGGNFHFVVHQASGMVAAQLDVGITEALVRLRAHAFSHERSLHDVADGRRRPEIAHQLIEACASLSGVEPFAPTHVHRGRRGLGATLAAIGGRAVPGGPRAGRGDVWCPKKTS